VSSQVNHNGFLLFAVKEERAPARRQTLVEHVEGAAVTVLLASQVDCDANRDCDFLALHQCSNVEIRFGDALAFSGQTESDVLVCGQACTRDLVCHNHIDKPLADMNLVFASSPKATSL
jgi:hypothetical protein